MSESTSHPIDIKNLRISEDGDDSSVHENDKIDSVAWDRLKAYAASLPYSIESNSRMQNLLDTYLMKIVQCIKAKDYEPGLLQWDSMIDHWLMLKYPIPLKKRILLARVYYELCVLPGMPTHLLSTWADGLSVFLHSKRKTSIRDLRLPWKPIFDMLKKELFLTRRQFEISQVPYYMGYIAEICRRFFHPAAIEEMLETFLPLLNGTSLDSLLATQYYLVTFLPLSHPQFYLPLMFRMWDSINSYMWDERMLSFLGQLAEMHVDPTSSDPNLLVSIPDDARSDGENRPGWNNDDLKSSGEWRGLFKDVGIFTDAQWAMIMSKCLTSMEIPLADTGSLATGSTVDNQARFEIGRLPKATWRIYSLAKILVYSMFPDEEMSVTYDKQNGHLYSKSFSGGQRSYLAGCKALDSLSRIITSTESFFHPSASGAWTSDLSAFIKYLASEFNKRWYAEQKAECKTPVERRLTQSMKRELVRCLRTPALLAIFSRDSTTVSNIQSCFKSMTIMEPDLILQPILERAIPSLEALIETRRTTAIIKALGAITLSLTSRDVYYSGSKHLLQILDLLLPGIDLNDPTKTLCTTAFLIEISQCIKIGDLTGDINSQANGNSRADDFFSHVADEVDIKATDEIDSVDRTKFDENVLLKESSRAFPDWVAAFIRRVILLFENLPEDTGTEVRSSIEAEIVDAVIEACNQICIHLSDAIYDFVLNLIYDYATTTVRPNCVHAVHRLVECVANANPRKALHKFMPFCLTSTRTELQNGASSIRTTSMNSSPLASDATFHWTLAIVRGLVRSDGKTLLPHKKQFLELFRLLQKKTFSKRGFSRASKLLSTVLASLTSVYPTEARFVNPDEWCDEDFQKSHYLHWGKLYAPGQAKISWHTPSDEEIEFALDIFSTIIKPSLDTLNSLLLNEYNDPSVWQNDFCRHLSFVRNAFAGISTLWREHTSSDLLAHSLKTSDILNEIPEFIATVAPLSAGFSLEANDPRYIHISNLRQEFGNLLSMSSRVLRNKGPENTFASTQALLRAMRTFMLEYGDSRDNYNTIQDRYEAEYNLALQYIGQKSWPRALYVRKARFYHAARLRWNSVERFRGPLQDDIIDEILEWSLWHYSTIRSTSQTLLEDICKSYDGVRQRTLPKLYDVLTLDSPDYRVKGALWQLNSSSFVTYAMTEPALVLPFVQKIFFCQTYEKSSIQKCVATIADSCLGQFLEPTFIIYELHSATLSRAVGALEAVLPKSLVNDDLVKKGQLHTQQRVESSKSYIMELTIALTKIAENPQTHWKYSIVALRLLRTLIRRDCPIYGPQLSFFLQKLSDSNPTMRYYATRSVMKALRYLKLRAHCRANPKDLALGINRNPLKILVTVDHPSEKFTQEILLGFREALDPLIASKRPLLKDRMKSGWLIWGGVDERYLAPPLTNPDRSPWTSENATAMAILTKICCSEAFWNSISIYFAEETGQRNLSMDNISCTKSIFQLLVDGPLLIFQKVVLKLVDTDDQNKQRAAAELLAGVIGGSKHWDQEIQRQLWAWLIPLLPKILGNNVKPDTLAIWTSFLEYISWHRDPRRIAPLINYVFEQFMTVDFNSASSFEAIKVASFHRGLAEEMGWKFTAWIDATVDRYWKDIDSEHDEVRSYIADAFALTGKLTWRPRPSVPVASYLVKEARTLPMDFDLLGVRGKYHAKRVQHLVNQFPIWREARISGPRAFESVYDRIGVLVCKWLFLAIHDVQAVSVFDYILPMMPELFRFGEVNDNDELAVRSIQLLVQMCGVTPPVDLIQPLLSHIFDAITLSPSYRTRLSALRLLQIWCFRQGGYLLSEEHVLRKILNVVSNSLDDEKIEVREMAGTTLSGILRSSPKDPILKLNKRFVEASRADFPSRDSPLYHEALRKLHGALIGICALIDAFPYTIEAWMPELLTRVLAEHVYDPPPIAGTVRKCASDFRKSHTDTWHEDVTHFTEDELSILSTMLSGNTYYA